MRHTYHTASALIVGSFLLCLACSSEENPRPASTSNALTAITLQLQWVTQAQFAGYYVALDKGWYRDEGIDLKIEPGGPDLVPVDLVEAGTKDFGTTLLADLCVAVSRGKKVVSIGQIQQGNGLLLLAKKSSGIARPTDFRGKKVGVWLGSWEAQYNALISKAEIKEKEVKVVSQGWSMEPFIHGDLDVASAMVYNEYYMVLESGMRPEELNIIDYADYGLDFPGDVLFTSREVFTEKPMLCKKMLRASLKGWRYAVEHPEEAVDIVLKYDESGIQTKSHQLSMMKEISRLVRVKDRPIGYLGNEAVQHVIDILFRHGIIKKPIKPGNVWSDAYFTQIQSAEQGGRDIKTAS
jgi:NitT/TauT family transport system substrate-binding protein